jgi:DNA helicase-2/ATP-dependent DNA helicase PcrA
VVESTASEILVLAGPGSGKTHTMVERVRSILSGGVKPEALVIITFTNAGAKELEKRLAETYSAPVRVPSEGPDIATDRLEIQRPRRFGYLGTLHGFALRELQLHGEVLGFGPRITVLDEEQAKELMASVAKATGYKGTAKALEAAIANAGRCARPRKPDEITAAQFRRELRTNSAVTFDTILEEFHTLLVKHPATYASSTARRLQLGNVPVFYAWEHLIVDEYQDSGPIDAAIYGALPVLNRCFVGDPDQAIYGFRGATVENILELARAGATEVHRLDANFRCAATICAAANHLIAHNKNRVDKRTLSARHEVLGQVIVRPDMGLDDQEMGAVLLNVAKLITDGEEPGEIAILCRYNATAAVFAETAAAMGIPVRKKQMSGKPRDWALARAAVELLNAPGNDLACRNFARLKYGAEEAAKLIHRAAIAQRSLCSILPETLPPPSTGVWPSDIPTWLARFGLSRESIELVRQTIDEIPEPTLPAISFALARDLEHQAEEGHGVTITTIHGAKGREWGTVYLVAMEQEITPGGGKRDVEEERRLAFVGITRAKDRLLMSAASKRRQTWGDNRHAPSTPSQFLTEVAAQ